MSKKETEREWKIFVHNVVWLRKSHGLTVEEMAGLLGTSSATLRKVEDGELPPELMVDVFYNIQKHFGVEPPDQLSRRLDE